MPRENMNEWDKDLYQKVDRYNLAQSEQCLQCGKCTGNCRWQPCIRLIIQDRLSMTFCQEILNE